MSLDGHLPPKILSRLKVKKRAGIGPTVTDLPDGELFFKGAYQTQKNEKSFHFKNLKRGAMT